jgi:hypothetical protein
MKSRVYARERELRSLGLVAGLLILTVVAAGVVLASRSPSMATRLAVVNAMYSAIHSDPPWKATLIPNPPTVPLSAGEAANRAVVACHEGAGTKTVATALVNTSRGRTPSGRSFSIHRASVPSQQ